MRKKNYVLDTNVLLHDPRAMYSFEDNDVIIPIYVIEEIDNFKKDLSELGRNARHVARQLDALRAKGGLSHPVPLDTGGTLRVALGDPVSEQALLVKQTSKQMDHKILELALEVRDTSPEVPTILVTKDVNMRVRGDALGLPTVDYEPHHITIDELYSGETQLAVSGPLIDRMYADGAIAAAEATAPGDTDSSAGEMASGQPNGKLHPHQYLLLRDIENHNHTALGRYDAASERIVAIRKLRDGVWGIRPRNKEQHYALDLLLNDDIRLVTLVGKAGTGKTLLALAAGLQRTAEEQGFQKLLVSRPIFPLGRDLGYLPGDIEEKLNPWMQPIYDNLELLLGLNRADRKEGRSYHELIELGFVEVEPLTYIRGRSLPNVYMIVDEAQNLTPHEVKTIITRAGDGTKIILTGDPYQIDNPYVDSSNNGLTTVAERFKFESIAGHITLTKGERSELAELATRVL
ncbi:MAG: PhoH family protein [Proteobacteria bacterium]|nr:PhoH family protein [Pseudomonadota bacterium]